MQEIHCVGMLRGKAFTEYPVYTPKKHRHDEGPKSWIHLGHCADMLVQFILCNAGPAIFTMSYVEHQEEPWPDFNINRQCRHYGALMEWAKSREIGREKRKAGPPKPKDSHVWPNPMWQFKNGTLDFELGIPVGHHHQGEGIPELYTI
ncbi:uncharacterized protein KD926_010328 [Aspergillus affinis]|uniref:uncharacterized protein n=1 Tax=Aspergillus affinis TaxID=1070780 RepID=UPI0022FDC35A|nr:uncharacterized protein KD926_010328 [Aspergillus affinis]KAI9045005.1 hypothetical protein KD926_010328 [Aspergillus affinis]